MTIYFKVKTYDVSLLPQKSSIKAAQSECHTRRLTEDKVNKLPQHIQNNGVFTPLENSKIRAACSHRCLDVE